MAFVGTSYVRRGKVGNAKAKETVRYIQHRAGKDSERVWRPLFSPDGPMTRQEAYEFIDAAPKGTHFYTVIVNPDPEQEDTYKDLDMRAITITTMQTIAAIVDTPVIWVAAVHDDHTDKNHVHALAALPRRLEKPDLVRIREETTYTCLEQRRELDRALERQARAREQEQESWEPEPHLQEDVWGE
jgi:hypothetical protein